MTSATPAPAVVGQDMTVAVTVTNNGPNDASGVILTDTLPAGFAFVSSPDGFGVDGAGDVVASIGDLPIGESRTLTFLARPGIVGTATNTVVVRAT